VAGSQFPSGFFFPTARQDNSRNRSDHFSPYRYLISLPTPPLSFPFLNQVHDPGKMSAYYLHQPFAGGAWISALLQSKRGLPPIEIYFHFEYIFLMKESSKPPLGSFLTSLVVLAVIDRQPPFHLTREAFQKGPCPIP